MASQLLQIFSHLFTTPLPYLGYDNQKNQVVIRSDLGWLDERVRLCFVKYAPLDTKGFLIETCNISTILTILVSEDCTRFQEAWVAKPSFWIPEADVAILDEDDPLPPFDLAASKKALENTLQITKEACLTYIPFTRTVIACEAATLHEITFVVCFPDNRGVFIHALYEKELLKALPYLIPSLQPLATSAPPFENHSHSKSMVEKMVKNTKKALQEHTLASKKIAQLLQNHLAFIESHKHLVHSLFLEDPSQEGLSIHKQAMLLIQKNDIDYPLPSFVDLLQKIGFAKKTKCTIKQFKEKLQEHLSYLENPRYVASLEEIKPSTNSPFLSLEVGISENRGERRFMEDASFSINTPLYLLAGVFDGHGGSAVADFAKSYFEKHFHDAFDNHKDAAYVLSLFLEKINQEIFDRHPEWGAQGCTALLSFVDKTTHLVTTATLGDSEATLYRPQGESFVAIPLSCLRDWSSKKDAERASSLLKRPELAATWPMELNPKLLRVVRLNVSRSLGDEQKGCTLCKPKITLHSIKQDDTLILACDGLKDFMPESAIISSLEKTRLASAADVAAHLSHEALTTFTSCDNVTVLVIRSPKEAFYSPTLSTPRDSSSPETPLANIEE